VRNVISILIVAGTAVATNVNAAPPAQAASLPVALAPLPAVTRVIAKPKNLASFIKPDWAPRIERTIAATGEVLLNIPDQTDATAFCKQLIETGLFQYAIADVWLQPAEFIIDPLVPDEWHLPRIRSRESRVAMPAGATGIVAVVDSGVQLDHPDLSANLRSGIRSVDDVQEQDLLGPNVVEDVNGHGTIVAGVISAVSGNGIGIEGVAPMLQLMPVRCTDRADGLARLSDVLLGARAAADRGALVVSVSYSGVNNAAVQTTGAYLHSIGSSLVWAAGNFASELPALYDWPNVLIVGATDFTDSLAFFSNFGPAIDITAPGVDILTTGWQSAGTDYRAGSGTSMSAPMVAAVLGAIRAANPALSATAAEQILLSTCIDLGMPGKDNTYGWGQCDMLAAIAAARGTSDRPVAMPTRAMTITGETIAIDLDASIADPARRSMTISLHGTTTSLGGSIELDSKRIYYTPPAVVTFPESGQLPSDTFTYTVTNSGGQSSTGSISVTIGNAIAYTIADVVPRPVPGVDVRYFAGQSFTQMPDFALLTPISSDRLVQIHQPPSAAPIGNTGLFYNVAATFQTNLYCQWSGSYVFELIADDGAEVYLNGARVLSAELAGGRRQAVVKLRRGWHDLVVNYFQNTGDNGLLLRWSTPDWPAGREPTLITPDNYAVRYEVADIVDSDGLSPGDGIVNGHDLSAFIQAFIADSLMADVATDSTDAFYNPDGFIGASDLDAFVTSFILSDR